MRIINTKEIENSVEKLLIEANYYLPDSLCERIDECALCETDELAKSVLHSLTDNINSAKQINVPVCQDTGIAVIFAEIAFAYFTASFPSIVYLPPTGINKTSTSPISSTKS